MICFYQLNLKIRKIRKNKKNKTINIKMINFNYKILVNYINVTLF